MTERRLQKAVLEAWRWSGMHRLLRRAAGGAGAIVTFHRVRPRIEAAFAPNAHLEVTPEFLGEMVDWAQDSGIDFVTLDEAKRRVAEGHDGRFLVVTFDDGYRDNLEEALPVLKARNCPFTIYAATGFIERRANPWWMTLEEVIAGADRVTYPGPADLDFATATLDEKSAAFDELATWLQTIPESEQRKAIDLLAAHHGVDVRALVDEAFMSWTELERIAKEPLVTIGAHTDGHYALAKLGRDEAKREIELNANLLQRRLGYRPKHLAYPYGFPAAVGKREQRLAASLGFSTAVLTSPGVLRRRSLKVPTAWPRISMNGHFQSVRFAEILTSGTPFLPGEILSTVGAPLTGSVGKASASSG